MSQSEFVIRCGACQQEDQLGRPLTTVVMGDDGVAYLPRPHRHGLADTPDGVLRWSRLGVAFRYFEAEEGEVYEVTCDVFAGAKQQGPACDAVWRFTGDELTAKHAEVAGLPNGEAIAGVDLGEPAK